MINFGCFPLGFLVGIYVVIEPVTDHCFTLTYKFSKKLQKSEIARASQLRD